ncbi:MAG: hypothetical protein NTY02_09925 [Acidobacteria bacterium]|nr:hypothetical protein [Acidobacteriota bacterium]
MDSHRSMNIRLLRSAAIVVLAAVACLPGSMVQAQAQTQTIWVPAPPPPPPPRFPIALTGPVEVRLNDGSTHTVVNGRIGVKDNGYSAETMQMSQAEYDAMLSLPIRNSMSRPIRTGPDSGKDAYYSVLIPMHQVSRIETEARNAYDFGFPMVVTLRNGGDTEVIGAKYGGVREWLLHFKGTEQLGGFGDLTLDRFLGAPNESNPVLVSVTLPSLPVTPEPKVRSARQARVVDVAGGEHLLQDVRIKDDKLLCQSQAGSLSVPVDKVARLELSYVTINDTERRIVWKVTLTSGETREFSGIGIPAVGGRGARFFECIPIGSISTVDFTVPSAPR